MMHSQNKKFHLFHECLHNTFLFSEKISQEDLYPGACPDSDRCYLRTYYVDSLWKVIASELSPTELFSRANACGVCQNKLITEESIHQSERPVIIQLELTANQSLESVTYGDSIYQLMYTFY